ncbi:MAG: helix-turn-helix transcriptional regulator [Gemmatimonadota bacterium]
MHVRDSLAGTGPSAATVRDRILGDTWGPRDEALVFAASSIINEITSAHYAGDIVQRQVSTDRGSYTLQGRHVVGVGGAQPVVLVYAEPAVPAAPALPTAEVVRSEFGLTRKEAAVAVLLASQLSNERIASELYISPHTARHHTQNILSKLGIRSRREVAAALAKARSS